MNFRSDSYSWIEFIGGGVAAAVGVVGAIWAAMWQVRKQEGLSAKELHDQMVVQAARELTTAIVDLNEGLGQAWRSDGLPTAAGALDKYNAAITAAGPVLHHVGLWDLALSTRTDVNLFLRVATGRDVHRRAAPRSKRWRRCRRGYRGRGVLARLAPGPLSRSREPSRPGKSPPPGCGTLRFGPIGSTAANWR